MSRARLAPLKITAFFLIAGCAWIYLADRLLSLVIADPAQIARLSIYKGWLFMFFTAAFLYWLIRRHMSTLLRSEAELIQRNADLTSAQEKLRFSHQQFVALVNSIEGIVWEGDIDPLRFTFVSRKAERMLGYPVKRWIDEASFFCDHLYPTDRTYVFEKLVAAAEGKKDASLEFRLITAQGNILWVRNNITVIVDEDDYVTLRGVMYDITPQKAVEQEIQNLNLELEQRVSERTIQLESANQELEAIFRALPDLFFRIDREGKILDYKSGSADDSFLASNEPVGLKMQEILPESAAGQFESALLSVTIAKGMTSFECIRPKKEGEAFIEVRLLPFQEDQIIVLVRNITGRKRAEQKIRILNNDLKRRAIQLQAINQELESFSYSVSHDLRTPLRHIDGFSKALQEDCSHCLDEEGKRYVERVRVAAQRMGQLIDDMLKLANVTSSTLVRQQVDLSAMARMISTEFQQSQPEREVDFTIAKDVQAYGDPRLLRVVLANLIGNAWKYTGNREKAFIEFGAAEDGEELTFFVRDNGAGFDMAYAGKLFTAFQRLHGIQEFEGNGIGLATVQRVIRRHGGRVWGEGSVDEGAVFYFTLGQSDIKKRVQHEIKT